MKDKLLNIWTIALKDIRDAFINRLVVSLLLSALIMLLLPKWLGTMISAPADELLVYDAGGAGVSERLEEAGFTIVSVRSENELIGAVQRGVATTGLAVPEDFPLSAIRGYLSWSDRGYIPQLNNDLQAALGEDTNPTFDAHLLYPGPDTFSMLGLSFLTMLVVMLVVGITLVPALLFEEKQTKTLDALLVSPATEAQLVAAKALVGLFYTFLVAILLFGLNYVSVVHWELTLLFSVLCGLFSVAIGLVLGTFYERQQDVTGLSSTLTVLFIGGIFVGLVQLEVPAALGTVLEWLPSTWLFHLLQTVFYRSYSWEDLLPGLLNLLGISILLYGAVIWRLRRSDR